MNIHLSYGKHGLDVEIPENHLLGVLSFGASTPLVNPEEKIARSLREPIGSPPLAEMAAKAKSACIVVCDITRPVPNKQLLPPVLQTLEENGIVRSSITILVATGLHRPSSAAELDLILGEPIVSKYRVIDHHASVPEEQGFLGETKRKTPVYIDTRYLEAELKITVGFIEPHLMAGFSGSRKMVAIGCAGEETIKTLHSPRVLDDERCREGSIEDNPLHHELIEISRMAGHDFVLDVSLDANRNITGVYAGHPQKAHAAGMEAVRRTVGATLKERADIVVTTCAGFPLDLTYYQAIKGMTAALPVLKKGGMLILAAECSEGLGSERFTAMATRFGTAAEFDEWIHHHPVDIDQWQLQECLKALRQGDVVVVSGGIRPEHKEKLFVRSADSVEDAVTAGIQKFGPQTTIAVIPKGPYTLVDVSPATG